MWRRPLLLRHGLRHGLGRNTGPWRFPVAMVLTLAIAMAFAMNRREKEADRQKDRRKKYAHIVRRTLSDADLWRIFASTSRRALSAHTGRAGLRAHPLPSHTHNTRTPSLPTEGWMIQWLPIYIIPFHSELASQSEGWNNTVPKAKNSKAKDPKAKDIKAKVSKARAPKAKDP